MVRADDLWWATAAGFAALLPVTLCISAFDQRLIGGEGVWLKPIKFQIALAVHFATLAAIAGLLDRRHQTSSILFWVAAASVGSAVFEIVYIMAQAARQEASHFNLTSRAYQIMYGLMAIGAVAITGAAAVLGALVWFDSETRLGLATRTAIALGLIGGTILTLVIALRLGGALNHHVGTEPPGAARFPFTGWSMSVGDLRVPHFFATHMMQAIPAAGLVADRVFSSQAAVIVVWLAAAAWTALTLRLFCQALAGIPLRMVW
jgi:hypothetical protein